ncbi:30S ribosomal protein S6 [Candidatus Nomurabacteria bacterium]|nr:30S ribosomal protein S6 [Candidatus Kaiserbacteria bacterium]MCB9814351.1 30S ribosomal protein S6 [Candidatus Nomurabacteria bacterium]
MSETQMPAAEAEVVTDAPERVSYELAFHVLPTVAEGEVATVFQSLKDKITKVGAVITVEEAPSRFDLAYEIIKYLEGRNRKFTSAYFGWVRFTAEPSAVAHLSEAVEAMPELLRHILVKLTKVEEANPFNFHEALVDQKVKTIDLDEEVEVEGEEEVDSEDIDESDEKLDEDGEESEDKV